MSTSNSNDQCVDTVDSANNDAAFWMNIAVVNIRAYVTSWFAGEPDPRLSGKQISIGKLPFGFSAVVFKKPRRLLGSGGGGGWYVSVSGGYKCDGRSAPYTNVAEAIDFIVTELTKTSMCSSCQAPSWNCESAPCVRCLRGSMKPSMNIREDCAICKERMWTKLYIDLKSCRHTFHHACLKKLERHYHDLGAPPCPLCREDIDYYTDTDEDE